MPTLRGPKDILKTSYRVVKPQDIIKNIYHVVTKLFRLGLRNLLFKLLLLLRLRSPKLLRDADKRDLSPKPARKSRTIMTQMLRPHHADERGMAYGGAILAWIDICAGVAAKRHAQHSSVTASVDAVHFFTPVRLGELVILKATVNRTWRTSMEVGVRVESENMLTGERRYCCHAYITFVAVDDGNPIPVPPIVPETDPEKRRFENAEERRAARIARKRETSGTLMPITDGRPIEMAASPYASSNTIHDEANPGIISPSAETTLEWPIQQPSARGAWESYTEVVEMVFPEHANSLGICFGVDGVLCGDRCFPTHSLVASDGIDRLSEFHAAHTNSKTHLIIISLTSVPDPAVTCQGDTIIIRGIVSAAFTHSVEVAVTVEIESWDGPNLITNNGWLTLVAVDQEGRPTSVPALEVATDADKVRQQGGIDRKKRRLEERADLEKLLGLSAGAGTPARRSTIHYSAEGGTSTVSQVKR
ncbi:hypothetical protein HK104_003426 [Borealophlyctis nickersoniae]|nr:hypothetical protein HK104_003426 [Borealophlyctis nickersoniae]